MDDNNEEQETSLDDISWPEVEWGKLEIIDVIFYDSMSEVDKWVKPRHNEQTS